MSTDKDCQTCGAAAARSIGIVGAAALSMTLSAAAAAQPPPEPPAAPPPESAGPESEREQSGADECGALPGHDALGQALAEIVAPGDTDANGGLGNHVWAALVDRGGIVCAITHSGDDVGDQWPGSRAVAAAKAVTANAFSLPDFALSTANLYWLAQPGSSLYGMEAANPVDASALLEGEVAAWGSAEDPLVGRPLGGTIVFGGGLALYTADGEVIGGLGISGDESCTDHVIAWRLRQSLDLDHVPDGVAPGGTDNMIHDVVTDPATGQDESASGYGHPTCSAAAEAIVEQWHQAARAESDD